MAQESKILETVLRDIIGDSNLPSRYPDFEALTRDLVRKLANKLVLVDRKTWTEINRPKPTESQTSLVASTERYKHFIDTQETKRDSVIPPLINPEIKRMPGHTLELLLNNNNPKNARR